jgi:hypothetical protein
MAPTFVPAHFAPPSPLKAHGFDFQVLGPEHNEQDQPAWTKSIDHIRATPGFADRHWPREPETLAQNLFSLEKHFRDYESRQGFSYAVLDATDRGYLGCVYFYPPRTAEFDVDVRSWVRKEKAHLDKPLHDAVRQWLAESWPWTRPDYANR